LARLSEQLRDWLSRVEIVARGSEGLRSEAARALEQGRPWHAREHALWLLDELPRSPVALALWADAAEAMLLDHEAAEALERLAAEVPFRADVWLRLARAQGRQRLANDRALQRAAEVGEPVDAADAARLELADRDLTLGDPARAERWLERLSLGARRSAEATARRIEVSLELGDLDRARRASQGLPELDVSDGRGWLLRGRLLADIQPDAAARAFARALILEAPRSEAVVAAFVARAPQGDAVERLEALVARLGLGHHATWRAAFATARGDREAALHALEEGARQGEPNVSARYLATAVEARAASRLPRAIALADQAGCAVPAEFRAVARALAEASPRERLDALDAAPGVPWADELRTEIYRAWWPAQGGASFPELIDELARLARDLEQTDALRRLEALAVALARPLLVAIVGEFNAGKSSFVNALLGEQVAPVGVLPTTATENRLVWGPERFARVELKAGARDRDRVVPFTALATVLAELGPAVVERVTLYAPLEPLRRLELVDTPGFNAPEERHGAIARAALEGAHVAIWLLDGTQPLKDSERVEMGEIAALGVPLLVLVNKLDRIAEAQCDSVLEHVAAGLEAAGLRSLATPIALSARLALAGRAGDAALLAKSRWAEVEELIERELVGRSESLRELALRRAVRRIADGLGEVVARLAEGRDARRRESELERTSFEKALSRARGDREELEESVLEELEKARSPLDQQLLPVVGAPADHAAERFIVSRTRALVAPQLAARVVARLGLEAAAAVRVEAALAPRAGALVALAAPWLAGKAPETMRRALAARLCEELVTVLDELSAAVAPEAPHPPAEAPLPPAAAPLSPAEPRLKSLAAALV
jgi:GTP-binding protein EngB required for normal cell division